MHSKKYDVAATQDSDKKGKMTEDLSKCMQHALRTL